MPRSNRHVLWQVNEKDRREVPGKHRAQVALLRRGDAVGLRQLHGADALVVGAPGGVERAHVIVADLEVLDEVGALENGQKIGHRAGPYNELAPVGPLVGA